MAQFAPQYMPPYPFLPFLINWLVHPDACTVNKTGHGIVLANCTIYNMHCICIEENSEYPIINLKDTFFEPAVGSRPHFNRM